MPGQSSPIDTVVLDIDGTLLDSNYQHTFAWIQAFDRHGHDVPAWRIHRHIGMGGDRLVAAVAGDEVEDADGDAIRESWESTYDGIIEQTTLLAGAIDLLETLRGLGLRIALASSGIPRHAKHALDLLDADTRADAWTTSEDADESKPDPELIDRALEKAGGRRAVLVGDSVWDMEAARRRGLPAIGVLCGGFGAGELMSAGAQVVVDDPVALVEDVDEILRTVAP